VTKAAFAELIGVSRGRVSQLVKAGLPVDEEGRVPVAEARRWYEENTAPTRRKSAPEPSARAELDRLKAERERLQLEKLRGEVIGREEARRAAFARARHDRDAWTAWAGRIASSVAVETGADRSKLFAALDREVRVQLAELAATPMGALSDE
jgi:phage terminase Nu1 subunit (DNA packaging protein)